MVLAQSSEIRVALIILKFGTEGLYLYYLISKILIEFTVYLDLAGVWQYKVYPWISSSARNCA